VPLIALFLCSMVLAIAADPAASEPRFTADGQFVRPDNYREWIFLSSGLGMSYGPTAQQAGANPPFDNVFVHPTAYRAFLETGKWPDKTMFALEIRGAESHGSINKDGHFQAGFVAVEFAVKDEKRFPEKWAYFGFPGATATAKAFPQSRCWACHNANAAVENTFVQFYPTLRPVAEKFGTLKADKLKQQ
jgi:hypothetical protein